MTSAAKSNVFPVKLRRWKSNCEREENSACRMKSVGLDLRNRLRKARAAYADFRQKVFSANPALKIGRGDLAPLKLDDIRSLITDTSTALVEFTITENNTYLFVLTADKAPQKRHKENDQRRLISKSIRWRSNTMSSHQECDTFSNY